MPEQFQRCVRTTGRDALTTLAKMVAGLSDGPTDGLAQATTDDLCLMLSLVEVNLIQLPNLRSAIEDVLRGRGLILGPLHITEEEGR